MGYRIDIKRLIIYILIAILLILVIRGCVAANRQKKQREENLPLTSDFILKVYDHKADSVRSMPLEEYLIGVTAAEMPASFEPEALKAQAVAARTFTVRRMVAFGGKPCGKGGCDVCTDSSCCQAWESDAAMEKNWGKNHDKYYEKVRSAVYGTRGMIAIYDSEPIEAMYHSTSGGRTEDSENVYSSALPYLRSVESPGEENAPYYAGEENYSRKNFAKLVNKNFPKADLSARKLEDQVKILSRYNSGRVAELKIGKTTATGREFRGALELQSTNFDIIFRKDDVKIKTIGFGHGVGLSQLGANAMAKEGASYSEILHHYYTGIKLEDLNNMG